mgnify:CR=1 FL=1
MNHMPRGREEIRALLSDPQRRNTLGYGELLAMVVELIEAWDEERRHSRRACAEAYQRIGATMTDADVKLLDNLSALTNGETAPHDWEDV